MATAADEAAQNDKVGLLYAPKPPVDTASADFGILNAGTRPAEAMTIPPGETAAAYGASIPIPAETTAEENGAIVEKWPGWPGVCVFRLIVPVAKVGSIIGKKGDLIKKMCEETRARIKVLEGPASTTDRVVLIWGKEETQSPLAPAMDAAIRVFRRVSGLSDNIDEANSAGIAFCSIRLLVASSQAINLIGKHGSSIKAIQVASGASIRIIEETPFYIAADERIVELHGEALKVLKALEGVLGQLRKFLVDPSVIPLFEKSYNTLVSQDRQVGTLVDKASTPSQVAIETLPVLARRESLFGDSRLAPLAPHIQPSGISLYGQESSLTARQSPALGRITTPIVTQVSQTMQVPFSYAEDIIGVDGANIAYIRRASGAVISVQEGRHPDEITVETKGTSSQVQTAQQLIQEFINNHKEPVSSSYGVADTGYGHNYAQLGNPKESLLSAYGHGETEAGYRQIYAQLGASSYPAASLSAQPYSSNGYASSLSAQPYSSSGYASSLSAQPYSSSGYASSLLAQPYSSSGYTSLLSAQPYSSSGYNYTSSDVGGYSGFKL